MGIFKQDKIDKDQDFYRRVSIIGREAFKVIVAIMLVAFLVFKFPNVKNACLKIEQYIRGIFFGIIFAFLLDPICRFIKIYTDRMFARFKHGKKISKGISIFLSMIVGLGMVVFLFSMILPNLVDSITKLVTALPDYARMLQDWITEIARDHTEIAEYLTTFINSASGTLSTWIQTKLADASAQVVSQLTSSIIDLVKFIINVIVGLVISVYLLRDKERAIGQMKKLTYALLPSRYADLVLETAHEGNRIFGGFIHGKTLDSLIVGLICLIFCMIMNMPYAVLISVIVCITNIIPVFGPFLGAVPSAFLILFVSPVKCLEFLIFIVVLQQVDGNIIGPRILGDEVGLNEFWVTFSLLLFGGIFGFFGMLIGVPLFAVCYYIVVRLMNYSLRKKKMPEESLMYYGVQSSVDIPRSEAAAAQGDGNKTADPWTEDDREVDGVFKETEYFKEAEGIAKAREDAEKPDTADKEDSKAAAEDIEK